MRGPAGAAQRRIRRSLDVEVLTMWHDGWGWGAGAWVMVMLMVLFWGAIIATVVWAIRQYRPKDADRGDTSTSAMRILEERFARGEIDRDEFEQRRATLRGQ